MGPTPAWRPTVLVVDDVGDNRELVCAILRHAEFRVVQAETGAEALSQALGIPDLIVLDVMLPDIDGLEVCRRLKADPRTAAIPLMHLSGMYRDPLAKARALDSGADAYLTKPVEPAELVATIRALLRARRAEAELRAVFEGALDGMVITDDAGRYVEVNEAAARIFGVPRERLVGRMVSEFTPLPFDFDAAWASFRARGSEQGEITLVRPDGGRRVVEYAATARITPGRHLSILRDVTDRKRAEVALQRHVQIIDQINDAVVVTTLRGTITAWNRGAERLFGYPLAEALGRHVSFLHVDAQPAREDLVREVANVGRHEVEVRCRCRSGEEIWIHVSRSLLSDPGGAPLGVISYSIDITEQRRMLDALRASEARAHQLAQRLQTVQEEERRRLAAEVHDELGQALTGIKLGVSLLGAREGADAARAASTLALIDDTIARVRRIASELRPSVLTLGLDTALEWQVDELRARTGLRCGLSGTLARALDGERSLALFRVCQETLTNVVRHANARSVVIRLDDDGAVVTLTIRDDGIGIDPVAAARSRSFGILGMSERLRALDGVLEVARAPGGGTIVRARLPRGDH